ncbi:MAG: hypothetical protein HND48_19440 [Chloroflexi bacterium]|nr:hypothetical protein [Chloroflexota bacterium]
MFRNLTISRTLTIILWLLLPVVGLRVQNDPDVWWQLRSGEQNLAAGHIMQADQFSYTFAGSEARLQHEWLAQPVLVAFWRTLGHVGLSLYAVICGLLGMAMLYRTMHGGPYLKAFITVLGATSASIFWGARPLMLSFILAAVTLWLAYGYLRGRSVWRLWVLPPMFVLWINLHGGWPQGALILMAAAAGMVVNVIVFRRVLPPRAAAALGVDQPDTPDLRAEIRKIALFLAPCIAAAALIPFLNPYGPQLLTVPIDTIGFDFQPIFIEEWRAPTLARIEMIPFFATVTLTALVIVLDWRRINFVEVIMVAGASYMALTSARHIAFATSIAVVPLSIHLANLGADRGIRIGRTTRVTPSPRTPQRRADRGHRVRQPDVRHVHAGAGQPRQRAARTPAYRRRCGAPPHQAAAAIVQQLELRRLPDLLRARLSGVHRRPRRPVSRLHMGVHRHPPRRSGLAGRSGEVGRQQRADRAGDSAGRGAPHRAGVVDRV